jgi:hypothetical protein
MILGVGLLAACGGGGGEDGSAEPPATTAAPTTTTAAEHRIDVYQPIPGGSLHGTPRPPLENTGDDYVAITESLIANFRWLTENPDVALVDRLYAPGTPDHAGQVSTFSAFVERGWRAADEGFHVLSVDVSSVGDVVALRVVDQFANERVVDQSGVQVGEVYPHIDANAWNVTLVADAEGRWRIADWTDAKDAVVSL